MTEILIFFCSISNTLYNILIDNIASIATIIVALISSKMVISSTRKEKYEIEINRLRESLESFYYPTLLLRNKNKYLYDIFANDQKKL